MTEHSDTTVTGSINADEVASQEPMYTVVNKPLPRAATAASHVVESTSSHTSEQPADVTGYQIERISDSAEGSVEVGTPPRTEEMEILVNNSDSGSFDDAVYEIVD